MNRENREILFRGQRLDNDEWAYGDLLHLPNGDVVILSDKGYTKVKPVTVGQFTGLTDKNGNKIFEGNIVKVTTGIDGYKSTYHSAIQEVKYNAESGIAVFLPFDNSDMVEVEVIGNIYDNPELLYNGD